MTEIPHHFLTAYYSQQAHKNVAARTQAQWDAYKFCNAVKTRKINGFLTLPGIPAIKINQDTIGRARHYFGRFLRDVLVASQWPNPIIVPVPSKDGLLGASDFRSFTMVREALRDFVPQYTIAPVLRFTEEMQPAHQGGPRGRVLMREKMALVGPFPPGPVVLVDDLMTTGGTILAAYDVLAGDHRAPVMMVTCGLTVDDQAISAWGPHVRLVETDPTSAFDFLDF